MHEWAIANGIVRTAIDFAEKHDGRKVVKIRIVLGELQQVKQSVLEYLINEIRKGTVAEDAELEFVVEEAVFRCRKCGFEWKFGDVKDSLNDRMKEDVHFIPEIVHAFVECPNCGSRDFEIVKGRGVYIESMEIK